MKTTCSRARRLEIATSLYSPAKGSRAIYCLEKNTQSRIRGVGSGSQVIGSSAISSFHSYYLWEFRSFLCFFSFVVFVTNFIRPYLHQFSIDSHGLNGYGKPLERPFDRYQSRLEAISDGRDIRQINW